MHARMIGVALVALLSVDVCHAEVAFPPVKNAAAILDLAAHSSCRSYPWKHGQGVAPIGYTKGVGLSYAKAYCEFKKNASGPIQVIKRDLGKAKYDALAFYRPYYSIPVSTDRERLESVYALTLGLGMVESSGVTTAGAPYDSANPNPDAITAEAGLYQTSYDSIGSDPSLPELMTFYKSHPEMCLLTTFMVGVHRKMTGAIGDGPGADFQQFTKQCPAFATEYAAVMLRVNKHHYGTINTHTAEYEKSCAAMFRQIESTVQCEE
jgi:hypothetical protein